MPTGKYCFIARLASGGMANAFQLDEGIGDAITTSQNLASPSGWRHVTGSPVQLGNTNTVLLNITDQTRCQRLRHD